MPSLMCSLCTLSGLPGNAGDPCPDRVTCIEDGPCKAAVLVISLEEADAWRCPEAACCRDMTIEAMVEWWTQQDA